MSGHGGNLRRLSEQAGRRPEDLLDFSANINPLGPPECIRAVVARSLDAVVHYPDPDCTELVATIAKRYNLPTDCIVVGNGSTELLRALVMLVAQPPSAVETVSRVVIPVPSYIDYEHAAATAGVAVETLPLREANGFAIDWAALSNCLRGGETVLLGQPNNPTGLLFDPAGFEEFAAAHPATRFVVDEAFMDFVGGNAGAEDGPAHQGPAHHGSAHPLNVAQPPSAVHFAIRSPNVLVLRSLTKFYGIPGLRLGFAAAAPALAAILRAALPPWSVNSVAQAVGIAALADEEYARRTVEYVAEQRAWLASELGKIAGLFVYPGVANFLLVRVDADRCEPGPGTARLTNATRLAKQLMVEGIAVRTYDESQHLDGRFFRVAVRTRAENERLVAAIRRILAPAPGPAVATADQPARRARAIMFQGTSSNAGKSILTAALCRILLQDGVRVAPFKSQNMSLNSFVTRDGGEMGRAQVVQAQACRLEPDVRMNPILLKPNSDTGSQVIVRGRPVGNMRVGQYVQYKPAAFAAAKECYDSLADEFDVVVLEGAGSPGEVNLKSHDIVNMRMAEYAAAPVLVVGDIDRGGVFASFVGTMEVLAAWERALVAGWIVNRFRGDATLLADALDYTLAHTGRPVLGVVPFLRDLNLPQEDSVEFKSGALDRQAGDGVTVAVIDLPHISNFTDFDAFAAEPDVRVQIVRSADELDSPAAVIIPGSKNTLADLEYLRRSGLAVRIAELAASGRTEIVGICGGLQMLGRRIADPHGIESSAGGADGLALLAVDTVLAADKTLVRRTARHTPSGLDVNGYEIHHGQTSGDAEIIFADASQGLTSLGVGDATRAGVNSELTSLGVGDADGAVWGTYLHGVFDADPFRRWFVDRLRVRRGLVAVGNVVGRYDIEAGLDRLAATVRASVKMDEIYRLLRL